MIYICNECGCVAVYHVPQDPGDGEYVGDEESYWCAKHRHVGSNLMEGILLTKDRCQEIIRQCQEKSGGVGPWVDQMGKVMTLEEDQEVKRHWETMPGHTCYYDAFCQFLNGRV